MRLAAAMTVLCSATSLAQVDAVFHTDPSRGLTLLPTGTAYAAGASSPTYNPAGVAHTGLLEVLYAHERSIARNDVNDGLYVSGNPFDFVGLGLSVEWMRSDGAAQTDFRKTTFAVGLGGQGITAGIGFNWFSNGLVDKAFSVDLGLQTRFSRWFSFGAALKNADQPTTSNGITLPRRLNLGLGLRPLRERLTVGVDWVLDERSGVLGSRMSYSLDAMVLNGLHLFGGFSHGFQNQGLSFQAGLRLDLHHFGAGYAVGGANEGLNHLAFAHYTLHKAPALPIRDGVIALLDLNGLGETEGTGTVGTLLGTMEPDRYVRTLALLERASFDPALRGIVVKVEGTDLGIGRAQELHRALLKLKAAGKKVVALILSCGDAEYLVATAADQVYAAPEAMMAIDGLRSNVTFFGAAADKLGVHFDVARVGKYKNSPDQATRADMSEEQREALNALLDTHARVLSDAVTQSRQLTAEQWSAAVAEGLKSTARSKELKLIDEVLTPDQLQERLPDLIPGARLIADYQPFDTEDRRWGAPQQIAIIPVVGTISGGKDSTDPLGLTQNAGADTFIRAVDRAAGDPTVAAIVIRIESPGGDGLASDLMYRAVLQAKKHKPVIASMGDVAASGGYYASMGADEVWANPATVTGSIGVFYLKPSVKGLAEKLGVNRVSIARGDLAGISDLYEPWTEEQRAAAQKWIDAFYDTFIAEAAQSRHKSKEDLHALAQGRVWSGEDAHGRGLVDHLGGLSDAIAAAKARAGLPTDRDVELALFAGSSSLLGSVLRSSAVGRSALAVEVQSAAPTTLQQFGKALSLEQWQLEPGAKTHLGFAFRTD